MSETHIQSVQRAVNIINCFSEREYHLTLNEISKKLNLNINTVRGLVQTLLANEILTYDKNKKVYSLGYFFNVKSELIKNNISFLVDTCSPYLQEITNELKVACGFQIVQGDSIRPVYCREPEDSGYRIVGNKYVALPYHACASGKLILTYTLAPSDPHCLDKLELKKYTAKTIVSKEDLMSEIESIRKLGYAVENDEYESSIYSVAVPLFTSSGALFGTISISGITSELQSREQTLVEKLQSAKNKIEKNLHNYL